MLYIENPPYSNQQGKSNRFFKKGVLCINLGYRVYFFIEMITALFRMRTKYFIFFIML